MRRRRSRARISLVYRVQHGPGRSGLAPAAKQLSRPRRGFPERDAPILAGRRPALQFSSRYCGAIARLPGEVRSLRFPALQNSRRQLSCEQADSATFMRSISSCRSAALQGSSSSGVYKQAVPNDSAGRTLRSWLVTYPRRLDTVAYQTLCFPQSAAIAFGHESVAIGHRYMDCRERPPRQPLTQASHHAVSAQPRTTG